MKMDTQDLIADSFKKFSKKAKKKKPVVKIHKKKVEEKTTAKSKCYLSMRLLNRLQL